MKSILFKIITLFSIIASSCIKKDMPNPVPCLNPPCDTLVPIEDTFMVWQVPMLPDFTYGFSISPILEDDYLYYSNHLTVFGEPIHKVNKLNGKNIWTTNSDCHYSSNTDLGFYSWGNKIVLKQAYCINIRNKSDGKITGDINFKNFPNGACDLRMSGFDSWVYLSAIPYNEIKENTNHHVVRINVETFQIDTLCSIYSEDNYYPLIEAPISYLNKFGDTLILFSNRSHNFKKGGGKVDFYCFNISKKKLEWLNKDIEETGIGAVYTPQIVGDRVYYQGSNEVFMFDIATGAKIWSRRFPGESYYLTKHIIAENKIFMYNDGVGLRALDLNSGLTIWENNDANYDGGLVGGLCYHNSNIYFIGGDEGYAAIFGLRADTGKQFWKYRTPNYKKYPKSTFGYINMISDPETGYLYTGDGVFMMCLKPPK